MESERETSAEIGCFPLLNLDDRPGVKWQNGTVADSVFNKSKLKPVQMIEMLKYKCKIIQWRFK